jgi:hypothetical protein
MCSTFACVCHLLQLTLLYYYAVVAASIFSDHSIDLINLNHSIDLLTMPVQTRSMMRHGIQSSVSSSSPGSTCLPPLTSSMDNTPPVSQEFKVSLPELIDQCSSSSTSSFDDDISSTTSSTLSDSKFEILEF